MTAPESAKTVPVVVADWSNINVPALAFVPPVKVLVFVKVKDDEEPVSFVRVPAPLITPDKV